MKTLLASAMLLVAVPMAAQAPGKADPHASHSAPAAQPAPPGPQVPKWMQSLDMTPAQRQEIARIHHDAHARMDAAKKQWASKGKSLDNDAAAKAEMQKLMDAEHAAFRAALSPAVQPAYDAALKAHMGAEHGTAAGQPAGMKHDGMKHDGMKHDGMKHDGMKHDGMKHDGMKHDGMKHDGMKHDGMKHDGMKAGADKPRCCDKGESKPPTGAR